MTNGIIYSQTLNYPGRASQEDGYNDLAIAIVKQAVRDYETVLMKLFSRPSGAKKAQLEQDKVELEMFFHSEWYSTLTDIGGDVIIDAARRNAVENAKKAIERKHRQKMKAVEKAVGRHGE